MEEVEGTKERFFISMSFLCFVFLGFEALKMCHLVTVSL